MISGIVKNGYATVNVEFRLPNIPAFFLIHIRRNLLDWLDYPPYAGNIQQIHIKVSNQVGRGKKPTIAIKGMLWAEGYRWKNTVQAWCRTYPAQDFSIQQYFDKAEWISHAAGVEVQFSDDLENTLAKYYLERGQCTPIINNLPKI